MSTAPVCGIDFDLADGAAVGKDRIVHLVVGHDRDAVRKIIGQRMLRDFLRELEEVQCAVGAARAKAAVAELDLVGRRAQNDAGRLFSFCNELRERLGEHRCGMPHGATGMGAATHLHHIGIAEDDLDGLGGHMQEVGDDLGKARLVPLSARLGADHDLDLSPRRHRDARLLVGCADGGFDVVRKPAAEELAAPPRRALARGKAVPVGDRHRAVHVLLVAPAVVGHAHRVAIGHELRGDQVPAAQLDAVDTEARGCKVDEALDGEGDFRAAGAAVGLGRRGVGEDGERAQGRGRDRIRPGNEAGAFGQRRERHAACAHIADIGGAHRQKAPVKVERELDLGDEIAALVVAEECL